MGTDRLPPGDGMSSDDDAVESMQVLQMAQAFPLACNLDNSFMGRCSRNTPTAVQRRHDAALREWQIQIQLLRSSGFREHLQDGHRTPIDALQTTETRRLAVTHHRSLPRRSGGYLNHEPRGETAPTTRNTRRGEELAEKVRKRGSGREGRTSLG